MTALSSFALLACGIDAVGAGAAPEAQALPEAGLPFEAGVPDAGTCRSITTTTPGSLVAPKVAAAPVLDGDLGEWTSCFVALDRLSAFQTRELVGGSGYVSGEFSVVHDGAKIFVAARVKGIAPLGDNGGPKLFDNDAVEIYFDGDGTTEAGYGADAVQLVVDHAGRVGAWRNTVGVSVPSVRAAGKVEPDGATFAIELEVAADTFGRSSLANVVGFDIAFDNGSGTEQLSQIVWFQKCRASDGCACASGGDSPDCDSRQFGSLMLAP